MRIVRQGENELFGLLWAVWLSVAWLIPLVLAKTGLFAAGVVILCIGYFGLFWIAIGTPRHEHEPVEGYE